MGTYRYDAFHCLHNAAPGRLPKSRPTVDLPYFHVTEVCQPDLPETLLPIRLARNAAKDTLCAPDRIVAMMMMRKRAPEEEAQYDGAIKRPWERDASIVTRRHPTKHPALAR